MEFLRPTALPNDNPMSSMQAFVVLSTAATLPWTDKAAWTDIEKWAPERAIWRCRAPAHFLFRLSLFRLSFAIVESRVRLSLRTAFLNIAGSLTLRSRSSCMSLSAFLP
jgi:hypothetical protein